MGKRRDANRLSDERKRELLEEMPYCPCGRPTTAFHHRRTGAGVKDHSRSNLVGCCELCHRKLHDGNDPGWPKGETND